MQKLSESIPRNMFHDCIKLVIYNLSVAWLSMAPFLVLGQIYLPKVKHILEQHEKAMGGIEHWQNLNSYVLHQSRPNGLQVTTYSKKPDQFKIYSHMDGRERIKSYDGTNGFIDTNGEYEAMRPGEEIEMKEEPEFYEELVMARNNRILVVLAGEEEVDGISCYVLKLIKSTIDTQTYWLSKDDYLIKMTGEYSEDPAHAGIYYQTKFFDFRDVNGYLFPFRLVLIASDQRQFELNYSQIEVNPTLDDDIFAFEPRSTQAFYTHLKDVGQDDRRHGFTFYQETIRYDSTGAVRDTTIWYEAIQYPDKFRIDFGDPAKGNINLWRNDSIYVMRNQEMVHVGQEHPASLLTKGGFHYYSVQEMLERLDNIHIDHRIFDKGYDDDTPVYIIGAEKGNLSKPQVWYHADHHYVMRRFDQSKNGNLIEVQYSDFKQHHDHWIEGRVDIFNNGRLLQAERYYNINTDKAIPPSTFHPQQIHHSHWLNN